jgi:tol-pal system protein YbgF
MRRCATILLWLLLGALTLGACATDQQLQKQVSDLQAQVGELQSTMADMNLRMEEMNSSLLVLRETAKNNRDAIKKMQQEMQAPTVYIEQPQPPVIPPPNVNPTPLSPSRSADAEKTLPPLPLPAGSGKPDGSDEAAYQAAAQQLERGNWGLAIYDLNAFIAQHPNSAYVPRARYSLGEAYRKLSETAQATREYERCVAAGAAAGPLAPRALFWLVQCYNQLGQAEKAKQAQKRLLQEYPDSPEAKKLSMESPR